MKLKQPKMTVDQAANALHLLIAEGKIAVRDVTNALKRREAMVAELRKRLAALESGAFVATKRRIARSKRRLSAARRASLKLQGQYLGTVRPLSKAAKAKIKAIREKKGFRVAISAARRMAK
jgi:hypothetical protein